MTCLNCDGRALRTGDYCRSCRDAIGRGDIPVPRRMTEGMVQYRPCGPECLFDHVRPDGRCRWTGQGVAS